MAAGKPPRRIARGRAGAGGLPALVLFLFFISGALGLIYEVVWLRVLILVFGSTHFAVSTVLTAFMAGLAIGAYMLGRQIDRRWNPLVVYGVFEIAIGLYALAIPAIFSLLEPVGRWLWREFSPEFYTFSVLRFVFVGAVLVVPTSLMGGTLPALSRFVTRRRERIGLSVGSLYGVNTFGAVAGTACTGFLLVPRLGVARTIAVAAALNVVVGMVALGLAWRRRSGERVEGTRAERAKEAAAAGAPRLPGQVKLLLGVFALSGFLAMVYEIAWTRVLVLIIGSSVYAFTIMLTTFLVGLAVGAVGMSWLADRVGARRGTEGVAAIMAATGVTAFATLTLFQELPYWFTVAFNRIDLADPTGTGRTLLFGVEFGLAALVMLPPTLFLGGMFPLVVRVCGQTLELVGRSVGTAYASNTVGTIFGSALGGFVVVPLLGIQGSVVAAAMVNLVLAAAVLVARPGGAGRWRAVVAAGCVAAAAGVWFVRPSWNVLLMNSGLYQYAPAVKELSREELRQEGTLGRDEILFYEEGVTATVLVARNKESGDLSLSVDGKVDASSHGDLGTQLLSGHLPMLFARDPKDVLVIGYASGITVGAVTRYPIESLTAVEIEAAVIEASKAFSEHNHDPLSDPRVEIVTADGRNFLLATGERYDVITSEPSQPWRTIAANLFTKEYYEAARRRLKPGGVFCAWLQLYSLPPDLLRTMVRTFASVYPHVSVFMPISFYDLLLLGSEEPLAADLERIRLRLARKEVRDDLARLELGSAMDLLTYHLLDDAGARAFAGEGRFNTDDNAVVEFQAPLFMHAATHIPNARALVRHLVDPLAGARGLPAEPAAAAAVYTDLARAFFKRQAAGRAVTMLNRAQEIHATEAAASLIVEIQEWFRRQVQSQQQQQR